MLESAQQFKKIDSDYYVTSHQLFGVIYIILCNLQNTNMGIMVTLSLIINKQKKKKKEKKIKTFLQAFIRNFSWISVA